MPTVMQSKLPKIGIIEPYESPTGIRWIRTDKIPIFDQNGVITGLIGFSEDITDSKKAQEALLESDRKYQELVEKLPEMVFEINTDGRVTFANSKAAEVLGYSQKELFSDFDATRFVAAEDVERSTKNMEKMFADGAPHSGEYAFVKRDGSRFPVLLISAPIVKDNRIVGARGIAVDLTERKEMERRLKENERLAAIGETAGMVGHDLRNPLQAIISELYLAESELDQMPEGQIKTVMKESLESINEQANYMNKIVSDLQSFVKPVEPYKQIVNLSELVTSTLTQIKFPNNIRISSEFEKAVTSNCDPQLLKRVLINLVTNSVQAMPGGGEIFVKAYSNGNGQVNIDVEDTGEGIPDEVKPKLFTPLFTTKSKGQGFGLAVCKRVVEAQGGDITFESEVGKGTKFTITLPKIS